MKVGRLLHVHTEQLCTSLLCESNVHIGQELYYSSYNASCTGWFKIADGAETNDVRLTSTNNGRVELFLSNLWVPVANSFSTWTLESSRVVCRELGYDTNGQ